MNIKYTAEPTAQLFHADNSFVRGIMGPVGCLPHETEYLTRDGWKPIGEYDASSDELVAQYDMETSRVQYVKPLEFIVKPATKWVTLTGVGFRFVMSDDHYMPAVPEFGGEHIDVVATELADFTSAKDEGSSVRHLSLLSPRINEPNGGHDGVVPTERVIIPSDGSVSATIEDSINGECKYCFTVPTGYFVIRQFGRTYISHNSGKSVACTIEVVARALKQTPAPDGIRYSRWVVIRNHYPELKSTTIKTWEDWIPPTICPVKWDTPINTRLKITDIGDGTGIDLEVLFLALDKPQDVKKLLSLELTGGWINEAKEVDPAVLTMLTSRVGRYPSKAKMGGAPYWSGIIMDTNPMDEDHWYYRLAEEDRPQGYRFYRQPGALIYTASKKYIPNPTAENISNLPNGHDYYMRQVGGKDHEWIKVYLMGEYGAVMDGKPVYPEYSDLSHCPDVDLKPLERSPLICAMDFGLTPCCVIGQLSPRGQLIILDELVSDNMGIRQFANEILVPHLSSHYPKFSIHCTGDPAGVQRAQSNESTCMDELKAAGLPTEPAWTNEFIARREAVAGFLNKMVDGQPAFVLSHKCKMLRKGFLGGYCYKRTQVSGGRYKDKPDKNEYSHPHDALQYLALYLTEQRSRALKSSARRHSVTTHKSLPMDDVAGY